MTSEEKWKRIEEITARCAELRAEFDRLAKEKDALLMTRASDETRFRTPRKS